MREECILLSSDGPYCNVLKLKPPMVFSIENADHFVKVLDEVLLEVKNGEVPTGEIIQTRKMSKDLQDTYLNGASEEKISIDEVN